MAERSFLICWANFGWFRHRVVRLECLPTRSGMSRKISTRHFRLMVDEWRFVASETGEPVCGCWVWIQIGRSS
jgi:hypothetical protein